MATYDISNIEPATGKPKKKKKYQEVEVPAGAPRNAMSGITVNVQKPAGKNVVATNAVREAITALGRRSKAAGV